MEQRCMEALLLAPVDSASPHSAVRMGHILLQMAKSERSDLAAPAMRLLTLILKNPPPTLLVALRSLKPLSEDSLEVVLEALPGAAGDDVAGGTASSPSASASDSAVVTTHDAAACPALTALLLLPEATGRLLKAADMTAYRDSAVQGLVASTTTVAGNDGTGTYTALLALLSGGTLDASASSDPFAHLHADEPEPAPGPSSTAGVEGDGGSTASARTATDFEGMAADFVAVAMARVKLMLWGDEHSTLAAVAMIMELLRLLSPAGRARMLFGHDGATGVVGQSLALWREVKKRGGVRDGFELALVMTRKQWGASVEPAADESLGSAPEEDIQAARSLLESAQNRTLANGAARSIEFLKELAATLAVIAAVESGQAHALV
jgi:hypothetical protein